MSGTVCLGVTGLGENALGAELDNACSNVMNTTLSSPWTDGERGLEGLGATLRDVAGTRGRVTSACKLKDGVYRLAVSTGFQQLELVAKRLNPSVAHRSQLALERWLPDAGLGHIAPRLLGVAAERSGHAVWHLYEDLGDSTLQGSAPTRPEVEAAIRLIASLHAQFASAPVLAECGLWGEDHGIGFYDRSVRGAIAAVGSVVAALGARSRECDAVRALLERLECLAEERDQRARALAEFGGPDTLLHGDLWLTNIAVSSNSAGHNGLGPEAPAVRLIDWDHVGTGSFSSDLSTLVMRFPPEQQPQILELYRAAATRKGIDLPADRHLHVLFTTAEYARLACDAIWPALEFAGKGSSWAFEELSAMNEWFDAVPAAIGQW